jgi:hypothetical protein
VAAQRAAVIFQLDQVQPPAAEHEQVHLGPLAVVVAELKI